MSIEWARVRLSSWGRWCRGGIGTGLPKSAAFVHAGEGARAYDNDKYMPSDIEEIDSIVNRLPAHPRQILIQVYTKPGSLKVKAAKLEMHRDTLRMRLRNSEIMVARELQNARR